MGLATVRAIHEKLSDRTWGRRRKWGRKEGDNTQPGEHLATYRQEEKLQLVESVPPLVLKD